MSGKSQYDESTVINAAVGVFWRHGFAMASISDLTEATGLSRSSIYQRFGDKDGLFNESLECYVDRVIIRMKSIRKPSAKASIEALLRDFFPRDPDATRPSGCLLFRSCVEKADLSTIAQASVNKGVSRQYNVFLEILKSGVSQGELGENVDLEALAWYYFSILQGVVNLPPAGASFEALNNLVDIAMSAWPKLDELM
ncbi:GntR family transcriptional regulator [Pseudomonas sp. 8Z]|uniref:TetR/AcrR family transcriptional regulator n=1 Tax=Pseudomonas sp. 8Z TaxID=2653166 RepID=UPI0012F084D1|nr:TetR/AcrR family transcriptional regulator [Pseudomonas sp. 8Z]VXD04511.1 GntR family transcriptional regulator [Pseudomonas sp. 8Z]